jgi:hypothetical protein
VAFLNWRVGLTRMPLWRIDCGAPGSQTPVVAYRVPSTQVSLPIVGKGLPKSPSMCG